MTPPDSVAASQGVFVVGTGTGVGKTFVARGLARALARTGVRVRAIKPIETGCRPVPEDAVALANASGRPDLAHVAGFFRAEPALAPYAISVDGGVRLDVESVLAAVRLSLTGAEFALIEGAGGLLVPLDKERSMAEVAQALCLPLLLVGRDTLGTLSHVLTAAECVRARGMQLRGVVLTRHHGDDPSDASTRGNARILRERLRRPVLVFPASRDLDDALADTAVESGVVALCRSQASASEQT